MTNYKPLKIAVASGKGGTGKTLIATNLASWLSQAQPTLLVDLDVEEPNDSLFIRGEKAGTSDQFKSVPEWDESGCILCGICSETCKYHAVVQLGTFIAVFGELCHGCYACSELCPTDSLPMQKIKMGEINEFFRGNLKLAESRLNVGEEQAVPLINQTLERVNRDFGGLPIQIFDCPPGTSCPVVAATKNADFVLLVTEPTPFGLHDLRLAVEVMKTLNKRIGVVINRHGIGNAKVEDYCLQERIPVLARISDDRQIAEHYSRGELVYDKVGHISASMQRIYARIQELAASDE
jgi:MinD superfamily P-loop ATPase